jgi:uridine kinase
VDPRDAVLHELALCIGVQARPQVHLVAVDGGDAAGKTTFANDLGTVLSATRPVVRIEADWFENPRAVRYARGIASAVGYFEDTYDYDALESCVLRPLRNGGNIVRKKLDWHTDQPVSARRESVPKGAVAIIDGCFLLRSGIRGFFDTTIFLQADEDERLRRAVPRQRSQFGSEEAVLDRFRARYLPGFALYEERERPAAHADFVIDNTDFTAPVIQLGAR